ncbi:MAG TPA: hypothetical protein VEH50_06035 [Methylomirabilota bacterium]|nr:hypothetical protein [Methylomirabilota bacterium]
MIDDLPSGHEQNDSNDKKPETVQPAVVTHASGTNSDRYKSAEYEKTAQDYFGVAYQWVRLTAWGKWLKPTIKSSGFWTALATVTMAVTTGIYTYYARKQWQAMDSQLKQNTQSFRMDERAWVEIGNIEKTVFPPRPPFGTFFSFAIYAKNVGKTVATDVRIHIDETQGDPSLSDNEKAIRMFQDQLFLKQGTNERSVTPNKPGPQTLAPEATSAVPIYAGGQEPRKWPNGTFTYSFILGRIDYVDAFRTPHWKHLCFIITDRRGDLAHCQYGNDEDNNLENPN